jgi:hypothetical protein
VGLGPVEVVVPPEVVVTVRTKIVVRAGNRDMKVSSPVWRGACRAEMGVQQVVRTIVVGVYRMSKLDSRVRLDHHRRSEEGGERGLDTDCPIVRKAGGLEGVEVPRAGRADFPTGFVEEGVGPGVPRV